MLRWFLTAWLAFVVVRYSNTVFKSLDAPFNSGLDLEWTRAWLMFLLAAAGTLVFLKRQTALRLWFSVTAAVTVGIVVMSDSTVPALKALVVLAVAAGLGELIIRKLDVQPGGFIECLTLAVPVGIGLLALGQLSLGIAGLFNPASTWLFVGALAIPAAFGIRNIGRLRFEKGIGEYPLVVIPMAWIFLLNLLWAIAPEIQFDATSAHLAIPDIYLRSGGLLNLPYFWHSYFAHLLDWTFGLCMALGGPLVAKLLVLNLGVIAAGAIFVIGRRLFTAEVGAWSALIFYSTPLVIWSSGTTYLDLSETCFILAAILSFLLWFESRSAGALVIAGWISGVAIGTKLHAFSVLGVIPFAILWYEWKRRGFAALKSVGVYLVILAAIAAPWYAIVYTFTGNPVYPFMNAVFQSPQWELVNTNLNFADYGIGSKPSSLIRLPFWLTWDTIRFGDPLPRGGMGFGVLLAFPFAFIFLAKSGPGVVRVVLLAILVHFSFWALSVQYGRYFLPELPLAVLAGTGLLIDRFSVRWNRLLLFMGVLAQVPIASIQFWQIEERYPLEHALGRESYDQLLDRGLSGHAGARYVNSVIKPGERVLGVGIEQLRLYLKAPVHTLAESVQGEELKMLAAMGPGPKMAAALVRFNFAYVLAPVNELKNPASFYTFLQPEFLSSFTRTVYRDNSIAVFKICAEVCQGE